MPSQPPKPGTQRRFQAGTSVRIERRDGDPAGGEAKAGGSRIVGYASVFDEWTTLYEGRYYTWREIIRPGAFTNALKEGQDVRSLFNHDPNFVLGRTRSGTLALSQDATGLLSRTDAPDTQTIRDLVIGPIERGDVTGMSFAFCPRSSDQVVTTEGPEGTFVQDRGGIRITVRYEGDRRFEDWEVLDADLFDVSPVTYPAYEGTDCSMSARSIPDLAALIAEHDRPHRRTPRLDECRRALDARRQAREARPGPATIGQRKTTR